jgi:hypothetical protein
MALSKHAHAHVKASHIPVTEDERRELFTKDLEDKNLEELEDYAASVGIYGEAFAQLADHPDPNSALLGLLLDDEQHARRAVHRADIHYFEWAFICSNRESKGADIATQTPEPEVKRLVDQLKATGLLTRSHMAENGLHWIVQISATPDDQLFWATKMRLRKRLRGVNENDGEFETEDDVFGGIAPFNAHLKEEFVQNRYPNVRVAALTLLLTVF